jgi:hypothetical protein
MNSPKPNQMARSIVCMLLKRRRQAEKSLRVARAYNASPNILDHYVAAHIEACNAAELARRILYGIPL